MSAILQLPVRTAVEFGVPLIVWGENSQNEYGGPAAASENNVLTRRWLEEFGGLLGLRVSDLIGMEGIERRHLIPYTYPTDEELMRVGATGIFLGYYIPWVFMPMPSLLRLTVFAPGDNGRRPGGQL